MNMFELFKACVNITSESHYEVYEDNILIFECEDYVSYPNEYFHKDITAFEIEGLKVKVYY